jgi:hypothetical protein
LGCSYTSLRLLFKYYLYLELDYKRNSGWLVSKTRLKGLVGTRRRRMQLMKYMLLTQHPLLEINLIVLF